MLLRDETILKDSDTVVKVEIDFDDTSLPIRFYMKKAWLTERDAKQLSRYLNKMRKIYRTKVIK